MTLAGFRAVCDAEPGVVHRYQLDIADPGSGSATLTDQIGSNDIVVSAPHTGRTFGVTMDATRGLTGIDLANVGMVGGAAVSMSRNMALELLIIFDDLETGSEPRFIQTVTDTNNLCVLQNFTGYLDFRNEVSGTALSVRLDDQLSTGTLYHVIARIWGTNSDQRDIWVNGAKPDQTIGTSGQSNGGLTDVLGTGGANAYTSPQAKVGELVFYSGTSKEIEDIDPAAHYAAYLRNRRRRLITGAAA